MLYLLPDHQIVTALVGDASQAYPYFRAINNGLLLGTKLAKCTANAFKTLRNSAEQNSSKNALNKEFRERSFVNCFNSYSQYSTNRAYIERVKALIKNSFISLSSYWIKFSGAVPWQTVKLPEQQQEKFYQKGADIWEKLSGVKPPSMPQKKQIKQIIQLC